MLKKLKENISYILFLTIFTFIVSEISCIFLISITESKKNNTITNNSRSNTYNFTNANLDIKYKRSITGMKENLISEKIRFRTDNIGSIFPSSLKNINSKDNYILFCGGSTTEASQVMEGSRPTDIFAQSTNFKSLNLAKAGKGFEGCIKTIELFSSKIAETEKKINEPDLYIVSININTLSDFLRTEFSSVNKSSRKIKPFGLNIYKTLKNLFLKEERSKFFGIKISNYEHALLDGCCFAPSNINNPKDYPKLTNWEDKSLEVSYKAFLRKSIAKLDNLISKHGIPKSKFIFVIEPNSFNIEYSEIYRNYWKNKDARQYLYKYSGDKMNKNKSYKIINKFDNIYIKSLKEKGYSVLNIDYKTFPKWSFYDAVHYTDVGSLHIGEILANEINLLTNN